MIILLYGLGALVTFLLGTAVYVLAQAVVGIAGGIRVEAISVGFGPVLFSRTIRGCELRISACPWGGYTKFLDSESGAGEDEPGCYQLASPWTRMGICAVGPLTSLVTGLLFMGIPIWNAADQMVASTAVESEVRPCAVGGLAFREQPSTWQSQVQLARETAGKFACRIVIWESLDGWGGPLGFLVTSGAIAKVSITGWLTAQGILLLTNGLLNLLPIPILNGFHLLLNTFELIFHVKPAERLVVFLTYVGLLFCMLMFVRVLYVDVVWVIHTIRS